MLLPLVFLGIALKATAAPAGPPTPPAITVLPAARPALHSLLNFAETWARNWDHGGHATDARFTAAYGRWEPGAATYEPWLFDRATVGHRLFELTGDTRWRDRFLADFAWYRAHIDADGIFTPKGAGDTKYGYVTPFVLYERLTGDRQYRPVARRIHESWLRDWPDTYNPAMPLWTEREIALALESAVAYHELTGDPAALSRARALVRQWSAVSGNSGAPQVSYTQHEGGGPGGTQPTNPTNSPWMSALYFQAARRLHELAGDAEPLAQASRYFDWLDGHGFFEAATVDPEYRGQVFPRYLTGEPLGDAVPDASNMAHCLDVAGLLRFAQVAKAARGESTARVDLRLSQMLSCAAADFTASTRNTPYLPRYRLNPPRKGNWLVRGLYELSR